MNLTKLVTTHMNSGRRLTGALVLLVALVGGINVWWSRDRASVSPAPVSHDVVTGAVASTVPANGAVPASHERRVIGTPKQPNGTIDRSREDTPRLASTFANQKAMKAYSAWLEQQIPRMNDGDDGPRDLLLVLAVIHGQTADLSDMLSSGISPDVQIQTGYRKGTGVSLLEFAIMSGQTAIAKELIEQGADVNRISDEGTAPLVLAAQAGETNLVSFLLDHGATIDKRGISNMTALQGAVNAGNYHTAELLLDRGASVAAALGPGMTLPPKLAHPPKARYAAMRDLMIAHGAVMPSGPNSHQ